MKSKQLSKRLLESIILVSCYQQIMAGVLIKGPGAVNSNIADREVINQTTKQLKPTQEIKATTTTTVKPDLEVTTLPADARNALINNQLLSNDAKPLYDLLQPQLYTDMNFHDYSNDSPQIEETFNNGNSERPQNPLFSNNMAQFDDYEDSEISAYGPESECTPNENCENNEESLANRKEGDNGYAGMGQLIQEQQNLFEQSTANNVYVNNNYHPQTNNQAASYVHNNQNKTNQSDDQNTNQVLTNTHGNVLKTGYVTKNNSGGIKMMRTPVPVNHYNTHNNFEQLILNESHQQHEEPANNYAQLSPLEQQYTQSYQAPLIYQYTYENPRPQHKQTLQYYTGKRQQQIIKNNKPYKKQQVQSNFNKNSWYNNNMTKIPTSPAISNNGNFKTWTTTSYIPGSSSYLTHSLMPSFSYGNYHTKKSSPFSSTFAQNSKYTTLSSSTQYVKTPFGELVFNYSIGMINNDNKFNISEQIFNIQNDINEKPQ